MFQSATVHECLNLLIKYMDNYAVCLFDYEVLLPGYGFVPFNIALPTAQNRLFPVTFKQMRVYPELLK